MKKIICLILALAFSAAFLSACVTDNGNNPPVNSNGTPSDGTENDEYAAFLKQFEGQDFYMAASFINKNERDYTDEDKAAVADNPVIISSEQQAMMNQVLRVEEKYNCRVVMNGGSSMWLESAADLGAKVASGEYKIDIFHTQLDQARELYLAGYAEKLSVLKALDMTDYDKWGSESVLASVNYKGELYGLPWHGSAYMAFPDFYYGIMLCNYNAYDSYDIGTTPQEMDEAKDWTFDNFLDLLERVDADADMGEYMGLAYTGDMSWYAIYANGADIVTYDDAQGKYVFGLTSRNATNAILWAGELRKMEGYVMQSSSTNEFAAGKYTFYVTNGNRVFSEIASTSDNYGWVPFPYGPDVEYGSTVATSFLQVDSCVLFLKNENADREQMSAILLNEITDPLKEYPDGYDSYLFRNYFRDGDEYSFSVYKRGGMNKHWNYNPNLTNTDYGDIIADVQSKISRAVLGFMTPEVAMAAVEANANAAIDAEFNN